MQYLLNETEYQAYLAFKVENAKLSHKLAVANEVREKDRNQLNHLYGLVEQSKQSIKERDQRIADLKHVRDLDNKKLAEQAHELLCKEAELANLSSKLREANALIKSLEQEIVKGNSTIYHMKKDAEGTSARLAETEKISAKRLDVMNNLMKEVRRLKSEHVCVVRNPISGTTKVVSVVKADHYRKFGWEVSEEFLVDRPA